MQFFLDTADVEEIRRFLPSGIVDGVTTNPSLIHRSGRDMSEAIREICDLVPGPVSAEVVATEAGPMIDQGRKLAAIAKNVVVKVPLTWAGIQACRELSGLGHAVNVTLCFSAVQALAAAHAGAEFISPFIGRLEDSGGDGVGLIHEIAETYEAQECRTRILAASIRSVRHVAEAATSGAGAVTLPPGVMAKLISHPLTDAGLAAFLDDWRKTGQDI